MRDNNLRQFERRIKELQTRTKEMLEAKVNSMSSKFVAPDMLTEKLQELQQEVSMSVRSEC